MTTTATAAPPVHYTRCPHCGARVRAVTRPSGKVTLLDPDPRSDGYFLVLGSYCRPLDPEELPEYRAMGYLLYRHHRVGCTRAGQAP